MIFLTVKINFKVITVLFLIIIMMTFITINTLPLLTGSKATDNEALAVPIIMYHEIKMFKAGKDVITPKEFENDLKYLSENDYNTITMTQLIDYVHNGMDLPPNPIILTFDDGYLNNYVYAFPLLKKYNKKIVLSIIGKNTDDFTMITDTNVDYSHVTWSQLNEMLDSGLVEVQNHSYDLHYYKNNRIGSAQKHGETFEKYKSILTQDIGRLQDEILQYTGRTPNTFAYPYGKYNDNSEAILKKLGFKATMSCDYGVNLITRDAGCLYSMKRICRAHGHKIDKLIKDGLETIRVSRKY